MSRLVVITVDGLNARFLGPYGNHWVPTPSLDRMAAEGTVFDCFHAESDCHLASLRAMVSGRHPLMPDPTQQEPSTSRLITDDTAIGTQLSEFFAEVELVAANESDEQYSPFDQLLGSGYARLESDRNAINGQSNLYWIHYGGLVRGAWNAPLELQEQFKDEADPPPVRFETPPARVLDEDYDPDERLEVLHAYAAEIMRLDSSLLDFAEALSDLDASLSLVLAGTSGFALGEHREIGNCRQTLLAEKLHVPLIVYQPGSLPNRTSTLHGSHEFQHCLERARSQAPGRQRNAVVVSSGCGFGRLQSRAWSYTHPWNGGKPGPYQQGMLYAKPGDFLEVNEVSGVCPHIVDQMHAEWNRQLAALQEGRIADPIEAESEIFQVAS